VIEVTVAGSGIVTDLRIDDRLANWTGARISAEIMTTMRRAQGRLSAAVAEIAGQTIGANSETARVIVASYAERFPEVGPSASRTPILASDRVAPSAF
jgi:hypothetical protein